MMNNNNKIVIRRITRRSLHANRVRNAFATLAIILTTLMLTSVFTILLSLGKNMNTMQLRLQGTKAILTLNQPTKEQTAIAKKTDYVDAAGTYIFAGSYKAEKADNRLFLYYADDTEFEKNVLPAMSDLHGEYPEHQFDIMLSASALELLGIDNPKAGMTIRMEITHPDATMQEEHFTLCGWYQDYHLMPGSSGTAYVSKAYADACQLSLEDYGTLSISCEVGHQNDVYDLLNANLNLQDGQEFSIKWDSQNENDSTMLTLIVIILLLCGIIVLSGYLLIYNVMYISVTKDIRFYGLLKTIGTSPSQIKRIVRGQAMRFSLIGIPTGVLLGTLLSFALIPYTSKMFYMDATSPALPSDITFQPLIYIGTIAFALLTVAVSCHKPAKLASRIAPVEALKFNGIRQNGSKKAFTTTSGGKLHKMAWRNVFREKRRALLVFASLFMGSIAFLAADTFFGSIKIEHYIDYYVQNDYSIYFARNIEREDETAKENFALAETFEQLPGMENVHINRTGTIALSYNEELFQPFADAYAEYDASFLGYYEDLKPSFMDGTEPFETNLISVDVSMIEKYNKKAACPVDIEDFRAGRSVVMGQLLTNSDAAKELIGKDIRINSTDTDAHATVSIGSVTSFDDEYGIDISGHSAVTTGAPDYILVSDTLFDQLVEQSDVDSIVANATDRARASVDNEVRRLVKNNPNIVQATIKSDAVNNFQSTMFSMALLTDAVSMLLIMIGILNFINVMLTSVYARRKELAVLESIGMSSKQMRRMLICEGCYYAAITLVLILTLGSGIMVITGKLTKQLVNYALFTYPWSTLAVMTALIFAICLFVPSLVYRNLSKESITERLRNTD